MYSQMGINYQTHSGFFLVYFFVIDRHARHLYVDTNGTEDSGERG